MTNHIIPAVIANEAALPLVLTRAGEPRIDSRLVASMLDIQHESLVKSLELQREFVQQFGVFRFQIEKPLAGSKGGRMSTALRLNEPGVTAPESLWHKALLAIGCILVAEKPVFAGEGVTGCIASAQHLLSSWQTRAKGLGYLLATQQKAGGYLTTLRAFARMRWPSKTTKVRDWRPDTHGGQHPPFGGFFASVTWLSSMGGLCGGALALAGSCAGTPTLHSLALPNWRLGWRVLNLLTRKLTMRISARGASSRACLFAYIERITSRISRRIAGLLAQGVTR